jgi:hypothetical protein
MRFTNIFVLLLLGSILFIYGIGVGEYRWFPYNQILTVKKYFDQSTQNVAIESIEVSVNPLSINELIDIREDLYSAIIPIKPLRVIERNLDNKIKEISVKYYGVNARALFAEASPSKQCLRIYIQGHGGNPFEFYYHNDLQKSFILNGCDVLSMSMIGLGLNEGAASIPTRFGTMSINAFEAKNHGNYAFFFDQENQTLDPLSLFLYPHFKLINSVLEKNNYQDTAIMGISGGGWYTVWLAALIPELSNSISYSGSLPLP